MNITNLGNELDHDEIKKEPEESHVDLNTVSSFFLLYRDDNGNISLSNKSSSADDKVLLMWHGFMLLIEILSECINIDIKYSKISNIASTIIEALSENGIYTYNELHSEPENIEEE